jgi:Holliday junction resolvasome RuvABC endonuclease subunit
MRVLAIDPGLSGALCIYCPLASPASGMRWHIIDIPVAGEKSQKRVVAPLVRDFICKSDPQHAFIEQVSAMPQQGVSSTFRFGRATGALEAIVACLNIPITFVAPQVWKKFYGLKGPDKEQSRAMALRRFPEAASLIARHKDHGRAEAMLIAAYGAKVIGG